MSENLSKNKTCVIVGASHGGVNCVFALRKEGWEGEIVLFDADPMLPYHRPPLSKAFLFNEDALEKYILKSAASYEEANINLNLGKRVDSIDRAAKTITLDDGHKQVYDKLILATGARPIIPPIPGIEKAINLFPMRTAADAINIRDTFQKLRNKRVVVIGGGYIGLETAASLHKLGADVIVLEREKRILSRVTSPEMSDFFTNLHTDNGVGIYTCKKVTTIETNEAQNTIICADGSRFPAEMIVVGVGIRVNTELGEQAGLDIENGIRVNALAQTNDENIYAIGDCTFHHNPHYNCYVRLESVQNAVEQAKVAAAAICGKNPIYDTIPWFWSDQFDVKLQMVGLSKGYNQALIRTEIGKANCFSVWYFKDDILLAVDAVNNARAYMLGMKLIKSGQKIDKTKLVDPSEAFKPANLLVTV